MSESTDDIASSLKYREQQISDKAADIIQPSQSKLVLYFSPLLSLLRNKYGLRELQEYKFTFSILI